MDSTAEGRRQVDRPVLDEATHVYRVKNQIVPGYSEILDAMGYPKNPFWTEEGRDEGKALHQWFAFLAKGQEPEDEPDARIAERVWSFRQWLRSSKFVCVGAEIPQYEPTLGYACTPDLWGFIGKTPVLAECKRGAPMKRHRLQTAAQAIALEANGFPVSERYALYLTDSKPIPELHDDEEDFECWKTTVSAYNAKEIYA